MLNNTFFENMKSFIDPQNLTKNMQFMANEANFDMSNAMNFAKKNAETMSNINQINVENIQALVRRNAEIVQKSAADAFNVMRDVASSNNPELNFSKQQQYIKKSFENTIANSKELGEMVVKSTMEIFDMIGHKMNENVNDCMNQAAQSGKKKHA